MRQRLARTLVFLFVLSGLASAGTLAAQQLTPAERDRVDDWFRRTSVRTPDGQWGVSIGTMDGRVLWSANSELELIPASTAKLFTVGFVRARAGGNARISTRVIGRGRLDTVSGRWEGGWYLELGGDPTLDRAGREGPTLRALAQQLRDRGIRVVEGPLVLTSRTGPAASRYPTVWAADFAGQTYAPPVGPVTLQENIISISLKPGQDVGSPPSFVWAFPAGVERLVRMNATTVGGRRSRLSLKADNDGGWTLVGTIGMGSRRYGLSAVAHDPSMVLGYAWAAALESAGIRWTKRTEPPVNWPLLPGVLAKVQSPPFDTLAVEITRRSLNIGAELVLQWAAASQTAGPALLTQHVRDVVGQRARVHLVDGSGLSELNRVTPLTQMLYLARYPQLRGAERFPLLLPANGFGMRGLRYGMAKGVVRAKTGTLDRVATLAGYLGRRDGVLVISLMYNGRRIHAARAAEWELFRLLGAEGVDLDGALESQMGGISSRARP
jgi:serine-type D-Ala-D-Ala carboxypeptidase/endopeptidase (penicillin-binding protein 4)